MSTNDNKRLHYNSMSALAYIENGQGIPLSEFANHYIMVFDLTSTQEATHDFIHPELKNSSLSLELKFDAALNFFFLEKKHLLSTLTQQKAHLRTLSQLTVSIGRR